MTSWILILLTILLILIVLAGVFNFPYVPMFFGVYGSDRNTLRGKLILKLLWSFPVVTVICIYMSWATNPFYSAIPFIYLTFLWSIRANKGVSSGPSRQYSSMRDNLAARIDELSYRWGSWQEFRSNNLFVLYRFFAPDEDSANTLKEIIVNSEKLHDAIEMNAYQNETFSVYASIKLAAVDKKLLTAITERMVTVAWNNKCELISLDVMED
jgi:hypothetical protein